MVETLGQVKKVNKELKKVNFKKVILSAQAWRIGKKQLRIYQCMKRSIRKRGKARRKI